MQARSAHICSAGSGRSSGAAKSAASEAARALSEELRPRFRLSAACMFAVLVSDQRCVWLMLRYQRLLGSSTGNNLISKEPLLARKNPEIRAEPSARGAEPQWSYTDVIQSERRAQGTL
jgi:hypothetical protein